MHGRPGRLRGIRQIRPLGRLGLLRGRRRRRQLRLHRSRGRWPLRSGHLGAVGIWEVRLLRLRDLRGIGGQVGHGLIYRAMKNILQLVSLSRINDGGRVSVHDEKKN
jgi:hypothetical protein